MTDDESPGGIWERKKRKKLKKKIKIEGRRGTADILTYERAREEDEHKNRKEKNKKTHHQLGDSVSAEYLHNKENMKTNSLVIIGCQFANLESCRPRWSFS